MRKTIEKWCNKLWGPPYSNYKSLKRSVDLLEINQFKNDLYSVELTLYIHTKSREAGPKWARTDQFVDYLVKWECRRGIPVRNNKVIGDYIYEGWLKVRNPDAYDTEGLKLLAAQVKKERYENGYISPGKR